MERFELVACVLIIAFLGFHVHSWRAPTELDRPGYIEILLEADRRSSTPLRVARDRGISDRAFGRAAWNWGDLETERELARKLVEDDRRAR